MFCVTLPSSVSFPSIICHNSSADAAVGTSRAAARSRSSSAFDVLKLSGSLIVGTSLRRPSSSPELISLSSGTIAMFFCTLWHRDHPSKAGYQLTGSLVLHSRSMTALSMWSGPGHFPHIVCPKSGHLFVASWKGIIGEAFDCFC